MKNTGLIALVALGVMLLVAVKFNLMPSLKTSLYEEDGYVDSLEEKHKNGVQKDYYQNGNIKTETPYKNNQIDGVLTSYFANGNVKSVSNYVAGRTAERTG